MRKFKNFIKRFKIWWRKQGSDIFTTRYQTFNEIVKVTKYYQGKSKRAWRTERQVRIK